MPNIGDSMPNRANPKQLAYWNGKGWQDRPVPRPSPAPVQAAQQPAGIMAPPTSNTPATGAAPGNVPATGSAAPRYGVQSVPGASMSIERVTEPSPSPPPPPMPQSYGVFGGLNSSAYKATMAPGGDLAYYASRQTAPDKPPAMAPKDANGNPLPSGDGTVNGAGQMLGLPAGYQRIGAWDDGTPWVQEWSTDGTGKGRWVNVRPAGTDGAARVAAQNERANAGGGATAATASYAMAPPSAAGASSGAVGALPAFDADRAAVQAREQVAHNRRLALDAMQAGRAGQGMASMTPLSSADTRGIDYETRVAGALAENDARQFGLDYALRQAQARDSANLAYSADARANAMLPGQLTAQSLQNTQFGGLMAPTISEAQARARTAATTADYAGSFAEADLAGRQASTRLTQVQANEMNQMMGYKIEQARLGNAAASEELRQIQANADLIRRKMDAGVRLTEQEALMAEWMGQNPMLMASLGALSGALPGLAKAGVAGITGGAV